MRFNKIIFPALLCISLGLAPGYQPASAREQSSSGHFTHCQSDNKNEGRKLSMTVPGIGTAVVTLTPAPARPQPTGKPLAPGRHLALGQPAFGKKDLSIETKGNNITVRVPPSVDAAIDDAQVVSRQIGKFASNGLAGAGRIVNMIVLYFKQWTGSGTITPGGYPYVEKSSPIHALYQQPTTIASGHKLYFTGEGRLKSVVNR